MHDQAMDRMINFVCNDVVDPGSKEPEYKVAAVTIKKVSGPKDVAEKYIISDINDSYS